MAETAAAMSTHASEASTEVHPALSTVAGDQCSSCGAPLAADQRYCVQCGQRRGQASLPVAPTAVAAAPAAAPAVARSHRTSVNTTLIAGIGTLLLAMGVGVLIGRSSQKAPADVARSPVQVVTVAGAGGGVSSASTSATAASSKHKAKSASSAATSKSTKPPATVKGTNLKLPTTKVVTVGAKGHGPGYQHGKFTGNFFGGG